jgi:CheY-like chemotaxis protein
MEGPLADRAHMILLVDDDDDVRETSADMLGELGYEVVQASNGQDALAILDQRPVMSGLELSDAARALHKDLKVILVSGYFVPQPIIRRFLQKPFRTHDLDQAIQAELASR